MSRAYLIFLVPILYLVLAILTLSDYGINWDSPKHFIRGQSYLNFILTGKHDFLDLPAYQPFKGAPDFVDFNVEIATNSSVVKTSQLKDPKIRRSYFQSDFYTFDYFMTKHIHTHPEVNNLLLATSNYIFFQKLGIVDDVEAYHLFVVLSTFTLALAVALWTYRFLGFLPSIISSASLLLYPLIFSESHFNIKDPVLMSFFGLAIITFWFGFSNKKAKLIFLSAIFAGFALGTKFNTIFLPFILGPWVIFKMYLSYKKGKSLLGLIGGPKIIISLVFYPLIVFAVLYSLSPYLWINPIEHFLDIVRYYKDIGTGTPIESSYIFHGWNIYPLVLIGLMTPLPILFFSIVGFVYSLVLVFLKRNETAFLVLLWFIVPITRAVWPGMNILGDIRHILEFIPALAILSGIGVFFLVASIRRYSQNINWILQLVIILITLSFIFICSELVRIHPNENIYFNQLTGGLRGAQMKSLPLWGNTYGNVYLQGINWLNKNAEPNAKLSLATNYISSIPRLKLRSDIDLDNHHWSGFDRDGEYGMEMYYDFPLRSRYRYAYYETFLTPVHQIIVDGVPLLKIWKNDLEHTRTEFREEKIIQPTSIKIEDQKIIVDFSSQVFLTKLIIDHSSNNCEDNFGEGFIAISEDGINFVRIPDPLVDLEYPESTPGMDETTFVHMFAATPARSLIFNPKQDNSCILKDFQVKVMGLNI